MSTTSATTPGRNIRWELIIVLAVAAFGAAWFIEHNVFAYFQYDATTYGDLWPRRGGLVPHILAGSVAATTGLLQLWLGATHRTGPLHRALGKVYVLAIVVASSAAVYLALTISATYFAYAAGLFCLALAWIVTTSMAVMAIQRRALDMHRDWMIRSYIVTFAFVTFRLVEKILLPRHLAADAEIDSALAFGCWAVPLLLAEPILQWKRLQRR